MRPGCPARTVVNQCAPDAGALLPAAAALSILVGCLIAAHHVIGAVVFTVGMPAPVRIRRYGRAATKAGSQRLPGLTTSSSTLTTAS
ncbi:hypothetical protein [Streptomyces canus]|uniref:hypothetical protein n=1 Tax=Streptomyces canus TaxID=58343 RepID=UPI002E36DA94|nr:hypothetical protein [Streptomyces canus]